MKKLIVTCLLISGLFVGCGSNAVDNIQTSSTGTPLIQKGSSNEDTHGSVKPENLTARAFREKVMDYEKNPKQWVYEGDKPCIVDFYADWCRPCRMVSPIMEELAVEYQGRIKFYKVDTDKERDLTSAFGITSLPTILFVPVTGQPSAQRGALPREDFKQIIEDVLLKGQQKKVN